MGPPPVNGTDDSICLIHGDTGTRSIVGADTMPFHNRLPYKDPVFQLDMFQSHQIGSGSIDSNRPETVPAKLLVLFNEHVDNFASRLSKTNEKYSHGPKTPAGRLFRNNPKFSFIKLLSEVQKLSYNVLTTKAL
jgi:hypothetical protein